VAHRIARVGAKLPRPLERLSLKNRRIGGLLAVGAAGTQLLNGTGDVAIAGTLAAQGRLKHHPERRKTTTRPPGRPASAASRKRTKLVPVNKASRLGGVEHLAAGFRQLWKPKPIKPAVTAVPKAANAAPKVKSATGATPVTPAAPAVPKATKTAKPTPNADPTATKIGEDISRMWETRSGKALVAAGAGIIGRSAMRSNDPYAKRDVDAEWWGEFTKFDDDKRLAFGWASVVSINGQPVVDRQGDYITADDLEDAAYAYVHKSRVGGDMHRREQIDGTAVHVSDMVESMVFTDEKVAKMGLPEDFPRGWWVGFKVNDPQVWQEVRKRGRTGFSIHGKGLRKDHELDHVMGYR
jgi:hypothetical protein